jgi:UDPglucose 6-dehydrogenase
MNIGFVGLGKLGLPVALAVEDKGHKVAGIDIDENTLRMIKNKRLLDANGALAEGHEPKAEKLLLTSELKIMDLPELVAFSDIIFVPIQTPHDPLYEGVTRLPETRVDFDYTWLREGMKELAAVIDQQEEDKVVIIISTVLPTTIEREIKPVLNPKVKLCYNPFFIAMGTVIPDFLNPEFVLFGVDDDDAAKVAEDFYTTLHDRPFFHTDLKSAELIKVAYNTYIGMKIVFANTMMEICHHTGANVDAVTEAMGLAHDRLMSKKYLSGGMGDGGGCHPRDNIAMSWLANELNLSHNFFDDLMKAREHQTEWLADLIEAEHNLAPELPVVLMGRTFKPDTKLTVGSPAILLENILKERGIEVESYDPYHRDPEDFWFTPQAIYMISTKHQVFENIIFPVGSIVLDPHRYISKNQPEGVKIIHLGGENK